MVKSTESETSSSDLSDEYEFDTLLPMPLSDTEPDNMINVVENIDPNVVHNNDSDDLLLPAGDKLSESSDQEKAYSESAVAVSTGDLLGDAPISEAESASELSEDPGDPASVDHHSLSLVSDESADEVQNADSPEPLRRSARERRPPVWYSDYAF